MPTTRVVAAIMPKHFKKTDATGVISIATVAMSIMAAIGNDDQETLDALLYAAIAQVEALRPEARELLMTLAVEFIAAAREEKKFMVMGGFEDGA